jgi:hypothetical protein
MLTANLLPSEEKKLIKLDEYRRMASFFGIGIVLVLGIGLVLLLPSYIFLSAEKKNMKEEDASQAELIEKLKLGEIFSHATQIKGLLTQTGAFLGRDQRASQLVRIFFADASGVRVQGFSLSGDGSITLQGFAATRDDLLNFQKQLQDSHMLDALTFPISDIVRSTNIQFTMTGKLKPGQGLQ